MRPGLTVYKQISFFEFFPDKYICCYVQWKFEKRLNPAVLLIHKFSTEYTELVNQQFIFMKTTTEWVVGYIIRPFGGL